MAPNEKVTFREKVEFALTKHGQSPLFAEKLKMTINTRSFYTWQFCLRSHGRSIYSTIFFPRIVEIMKNMILAMNGGRGSRFSGFEKGIRRGIARSIYLNYSRGLNQ